MFTWADCAAPFGCLNAPGGYEDDQPTGLPVVPTTGRDDMMTVEYLLESAETGDLETVLKILASGKVDVNAVDEVDSYSALMMAAEAGHLDVVQALKDAGAHIEMRDSYGRTPLYAASVAGHIDVVRYLVRENADVHAVDCENRSVLWACCAVRRVDIASILIADGDADLNTQAGGDTAMSFAIKHGHAEVVDFLRQNGALDVHIGRLSIQ